MNRADIIRTAREAAGGMLSYDEEGNWRLNEDEVHRFAELVKQHVQVEQMPKFEEIAKTVREDELNRCIDILMRLHERASDTHNYYHYAVNVLKGEI